MVDARLLSLLVGVGMLLLAACGETTDVAVDDAGPPASASPAEPTESPEAEAPAEEDASAGSRPADADPVPSAAPSPTGNEAAIGAASQAASGGRSPSPDAADEPADGGRTGTREQARLGALADESADAVVADTPPIAIARPVAGTEHAGGPVTAEGEATVYEGTVLLTLLGPDGSIVEEAFTTATAGAPERGRWSHTFTTVADVPGRWRVVAAATDPSDGEGGAPARTEAMFHVPASR